MKRTLTNFIAGLGKGDRRALLALAVISIATHFRWLFDFRIFTSGDWWFISLQKYQDYAHMSPIWVTEGLGGTSATPGFYLVRFFEGLLTYIGSGFALNEKIFFFLPIILFGTFGAYLFLRQYFKPWFAFIGTLVFAFNTAMIFNYAGALTIAVANSLTPVALYCFRQLLIKPTSNRLIIATSFVFAVMAAYETRITLLALCIAGGFFVYKTLLDVSPISYFKQRWLAMLKFGLLLFLFHAFWLLPYIIGAKSGVTFSNLLDQSLFVSFSDIQNALTLYHPFWTNARPVAFVINDIPAYAWLLPVLAFAGFFINRKKLENKEIGYWAILALIGIFLVKQVNMPVENAYPWIFSHIPGFAAFRESSKFYLFIAIAYSVLIPFTLQTLKDKISLSPKNKTKSTRQKYIWIYVSTCSLLLIVLAINSKPLVTGAFRTLYTPRSMPSAYADFNNFTDSQPDYFRILWMPTVSRWAAQSNKHPSVLATNISQGAWLTSLSNANLDINSTLRDKASNTLTQNSSKAFLDNTSIKYVVVPLRDLANEDDFLRRYGNDRQYYIDLLNRQSYLERVNFGDNQLAIYENKNYRQYIGSITDLQSIEQNGQETSFSSIYDFTKSQINQDFNFVLPPSDISQTKSYPVTKINDIFNNVSTKEINDTSVIKNINTLQNPMLYVDTNTLQTSYEISGNTISIFGEQAGELKVNGQSITQNNGKQRLGSSSFDPENRYIIKVDDDFTEINPENKVRNLGTINKEIRLFSLESSNTLPNGSFEAGLWQKKVADCNNYDDNADIGMKLSNESTLGLQSLQLEAENHTACTSTEPIKITSDFLNLSFDYRVRGGQIAGYSLIFDDANKTEIKKTVAGSSTWQSYQNSVDIPKDASHYVLKLYGYQDYKLARETKTNYDNVRVTPASLEIALSKPTTPYAAHPLPKNERINIAYDTTSSDLDKNLISNGSFEAGLWQKKVADCNNYDDNADIGMKLTGDQGQKVLELSARRHAACTSYKDIPVEGNLNYLLSFNYQSSVTRRADYSITYNDANKTTVQRTLTMKSKEWHTFAKQLKPPLGATKMTLTVYAYGSDAGSKNIINHYSDFSLTTLPVEQNQFYIVDTPPQNLEHPKTISFASESSAKKIVKLRGVSKPFYLTMNETYNPLWKVRLDNQSRLQEFLPLTKSTVIAEKNHLRLNDFANGWYIEPAVLCAKPSVSCDRQPNGTYDINLVIEYTANRWFGFGALISTLTLCYCVRYLIYGRTRNKKD